MEKIGVRSFVADEIWDLLVTRSTSLSSLSGWDTSHQARMDYFTRSYLRLEPVYWCVFALCSLSFPSADLAEDPIVVHYSDPSLTRMEVEIGVKAAQKDRFEDIVVKYRDPLNRTDADYSGQSKPRAGRHGGSRESEQEEAAAPFPRGKGKVSRDELDELATILTPAQLKKFQDLNAGKGSKRHSS